MASSHLLTLSDGNMGPQLTVQLPTPTVGNVADRHGLFPQDDDFLLAGRRANDESDSNDEYSSTGEVSDAGEESVNASQDDTEVVDEAVRQKIIAAVEFYFSDEHVAKDAFMYKHIVRGKEGFVNLKLVASFRKVKNITKDWRLVCETIKASKLLELNESGTKVRRCNPLPSTINPVAKCVLAYNLGEKPSMGLVEALFTGCGRIAKISLYWPGEQLPNEVRQEREKLNIAASEPLALVEFSSAEEAQRACAGARKGEVAEKASLSLMHSPVQGRKADRRSPSPQSEGRRSPQLEGKAHGKSPQSGGKTRSRSFCIPDDVQLEGEERQRANSTGAASKRKKNNQTDDPSADRSDMSDTDSPWRSRAGSNASNRSWRDADSLSPSPAPRTGRHSSPHSSPKVQRRNSPSARTPSPRRVLDEGSPRRVLLMDGIIRQPQGPHGSGFSRGRAKPLTIK